MAQKPINVGFKRPNNPNGGLHVDVDRWRQKVSKNKNSAPPAPDEVLFGISGNADFDYYEVWFRYGECPFAKVKANGYMLRIDKNTAPVSTGPVDLGYPESTVHYEIWVYFKDGSNNDRDMFVDPDMVIDV